MPNETQCACDVSSIHGFPDLFGPKGGGIRFGSKLLVSGPPGAGKTTFALATVRAAMFRADARQPGAGPKGGAQQRHSIAYYISTEVDQEQLLANYERFGWFKRQEKTGRADPFAFRIDDRFPDQTNFYAITPMPEVDRPVPSPEELVNGIFNRIAQTLLPSEAPRVNVETYVIVDSITALLKGCPNPGEERRQTHEITRRLRDVFGDNLAMVILLAEQDHRSQDPGITSAPITPTGSSVEDYLADIVFRLYVRSMPLGRRTRVLEVVKSQGVNMTLGEHTWQIITSDNCEDVLRDPRFREHVKTEALCQAATATAMDKWGTIVVFPRPRLSPQDSTSHPAKDDPADGGDGGNGKPKDAAKGAREEEKLDDGAWSGTPGLSVTVNPGHVTLILAPISCYKTTLCKNFLKAKGAEGAKNDPLKRVLISFEVPHAVTKQKSGGPDFTPLHFTQTQFDLNVLISHLNFILDQGCDRLAFDGLSDWISMFERREAARVLEAIMVTLKRERSSKEAAAAHPAVFLSYEMPLGEDPLAPAALGTVADNIVVIRPVAINDERRKVLYVLKYNGQPTGLGETLSHRYPGELCMTEAGLVVDMHRLDAYTDLLNRKGKVKAARVLLQLFSENANEATFNKQVVDDLETQFNGRIDLTCTRFGLAEIGSTLESAFGAGNPSEAFNLSIHSVDEWWLASGRIGDFLKPLNPDPQRSGRARPPLQETSEEGELPSQGIRLTAHAPRHSPGGSPRDFWWFEVEKAGASVQDPSARRYHALPGYVDFGMFCMNLEALPPHALKDLHKQITVVEKFSWANSMPDDDRPDGSDAVPTPRVPESNTIPEQALSRRAYGPEIDKLREAWSEIVHSIPRRWVDFTPNGKWFKVDPAGSHASAQTVMDYALRLINQDKDGCPRENLRRKAVFTFDASTRETCACMFLELAWSFGGTESLLNVGEWEHNKEAVKMALRFLQFLVLEGLMPARCTTHSRNHDGKPILFSRQWYSTLRHQQEPPPVKGRSSPPQAARLMLAVPFMPVGLSDPARSEATFLMDIAVRQSYWMQRVQDYLHWLRRVLRNGCRKERAAWADSAAGVMRALAKQMESVNGGWSQRRLVTYQVWVKEYGRLTTLLQEQKPLQDPDPTAQRRWVELQEERERLRTRWISRLKESRSLRKQQAKLSPLFKTFLDLTEGLRSAEIVAQALQPARKAALEAYRSSREWLCNAAALDPWGVETASEDPWAPSLDDLMELQAWAAFRLQLLLGAPAGRLPDKIKGKSGSPAEKGLYHARWVRHYLPSVNQLTSAAVAPPGGDEFEFVPTGCVCAGSWMFGVGANSRSAAIQTQVLAKLTSLESAQQRATLGAGIPARKDFFYLCGEQPVKGMEYLNWRELLRFCGSRARRRDRVLTPGPQAEVLAWPLSPDAEAAPHSDPLPLYDVIYEEMLACLRVADLNRQEYAGDGQEAALERVTKRSDQAVETIYQEACSIRLKPDTTHHGKKSLLSSLG